MPKNMIMHKKGWKYHSTLEDFNENNTVFSPSFFSSKKFKMVKKIYVCQKEWNKEDPF